MGFTYLYGYFIGKDIEDLTKKTPSLVYIEANFHRKTYIDDVEGFFIRIAMQDARMKHYPQGKRILPILFINGIETEALNKAREKGAMIISLQEILGPFGFELLHFINNPWKVDNVLENCKTLIKLIEDQGRSEVMLPFLQELSMIKHLTEYKKQGWKIALNVIFKHDQNKYQIPWLLYDPIFNTPHICGLIKEDQPEKNQIEQIVNNYYIPYKKYIKRLSTNTDKVNLLLFTNHSKISNNPEIKTIIEEILFKEQ